MRMNPEEQIKDLTLAAGKRWEDCGYWTYTTCQRCDHGCQGYVGGGPVSTCHNTPVQVKVPNPDPENCDDIFDLAREFNITVEISRSEIRCIRKGILEITPDEELSKETRYTPLCVGLLRAVYEAYKVKGDKW